MKNILIIGGAGYIGSHIALELSNANYQPIILDNFSSGNKDNILPGFRLINADFCDIQAINSALSQDIYAVFLIAAKKSVSDSMHQIEEYSKTNIIGVINLLNLLPKHKIDKFIFASSAAVYGNPLYIPIDEKHITNPINYYGFTKKVIEESLIWYSQIRGIKFASLRYFNVVGFNQDQKIIGLEKNSNNILPTIMDVIFKQKKTFKIFGNNYNTTDRTAIRDYVHVSDIASANLLALKYLEINKNKNLICNLSGGLSLSVKELVDSVKQITKIDFDVQYDNPRLGDPEILTATNKLANQTISWKQKYSNLETIILSTFQIYNKKYKLF